MEGSETMAKTEMFLAAYGSKEERYKLATKSASSLTVTGKSMTRRTSQSFMGGKVPTSLTAAIEGKFYFF